MIGWVGDAREDVSPHLGVDADSAGDIDIQSSGSGFHSVIRGAKYIFSCLGWQLKTTLCLALHTCSLEYGSGLWFANRWFAFIEPMAHAVTTQAFFDVSRRQ